MIYKTNIHGITKEIGNTEPLLNNTRRLPDKRRVNMRWFTGSVMIGIAACTLMGSALYIALDGRQQLSYPAQIFKQEQWSQIDDTKKGNRLIPINALEPAKEKIIKVPTVTQVLDRAVISNKPFAFVSAPLAIVPTQKVKYEKFDPLKVFLPQQKNANTISADILYDTQIDSEITISYIDFPTHSLDASKFNVKNNISEEKIIKHVNALIDKNHNTLLTSYQFGENLNAQTLYRENFFDNPQAALDNLDNIDETQITITPQNVTTIAKLNRDKRFAETVLVISENQTIINLLESLNANEKNINEIANAAKLHFGSDFIPKDSRLRVAWENPPYQQQIEIKRIGIYNKSGTHFGTIALDDKGQVLAAKEPASIAATRASIDEENIATVATAKLPSAYDGIYRAAMSRGLGEKHANQIVKMVASNVDFKSTIKQRDELEVFFSLDENEKPSEDSEILYVGLTLEGKKQRYYRFLEPQTQEIRYYDENGSSAKTFLLRKPVPNGRFESAFGMRIHPIFKIRKMHFGVDFAAPTGTPIIAAGDGIITRARWAGGNGRHVLIKHANGYVTSYSHLYRYAKGIKPGVHVKQGQIIGTVGSSGYSTGPHLHYEIRVNKRAVNPMKVRLPKEHTLIGEALAQFIQEKERIDNLIKQSQTHENTTLAAL